MVEATAVGGAVPDKVGAGSETALEDAAEAEWLLVTALGLAEVVALVPVGLAVSPHPKTRTRTGAANRLKARLVRASLCMRSSYPKRHSRASPCWELGLVS